MTTTKNRKGNLVRWADECIRSSTIYKNGEIESESFNGQIAAFSVSVALSGLKPAMALYYNQSSNSDVDKTKIIELLAAMYKKEKGENLDKKSLYEKVINASGQAEDELRRLIIEYAIALKLAIRTFKFKKS